MKDPRQLPECVALDAYRLDKDWTWAQLADAMQRDGITMSPRTLHYLVKRAPADMQPRDRTLYKIRKYLKLLEDRTAAAKRRARKPRPDSSAQAGV